MTIQNAQWTMSSLYSLKLLLTADDKMTFDTCSGLAYVSINATKFHYMHTSKVTDTDFQCEGINIKSEDMVKMLGINIDKKLKFTSHVTEVIRKCTYQLNALKRKSKILNTKTKMLIYHAFIEANLNYCPLIWMNSHSEMKELCCGLPCQMYVKKPKISVLLSAWFVDFI